MATLTVRSLSRAFEGVPAVHNVSFEVEDGHVAALLGPSGCGKSTLLRAIAGLDRPDAGDVLLDGESVLALPPERRGIGLMFQELALFPHLSVRENVAFGLRMAGWKRAQRAERVERMLDLAGLAHLGERAVHELSGGERQRVALVRTLAPAPGVVLLDEPLGALDEERKRDLRDEVRGLLREVGATAVVVSHDLRDAIAIADDLLVMDRGELLQRGPLAEVLARPADAAVAGLVGYVVLLDGEVRDGKAVEDGVGAIPGAALEELPRSGAVRVLAHPSTLLAVPADAGIGSGLRGSVAAVRPDGPQHRLEVALGERRVEVRWEWDLVPPQPGTLVEIAARPGTLRAFTTSHPGAAPAGEGRDGPATWPDADVESRSESATPGAGGAGREPSSAAAVDADGVDDERSGPAEGT